MAEIKFLDETNNIQKDLLDVEALKVAQTFEKATLTTNQVRKFYDEVKKYEKMLENGKSFSDIEPLIYMLKSKAKYAERRADKKINMKVFYDFIDGAINQIKNGSTEDLKKKNYYAFCLFFEAVYGFANLKKN